MTKLRQFLINSFQLLCRRTYEHTDNGKTIPCLSASLVRTVIKVQYNWNTEWRLVWKGNWSNVYSV